MYGGRNRESDSPLGSFADINSALEDVNVNVSTSSQTNLLPPLPQRPTLLARRSHQNVLVSENIPTLISSTPTVLQDNPVFQNRALTEIPSVTATASAPNILHNDNSKRNRTSSSSTNDSVKQQCKRLHTHDTTPNNNLRVSFVLQNNHTGETSTSARPLDATTSTTNASSLQPVDMATDTEERYERATINQLAQPMWDATRLHLINQQKSALRGAHLRSLTADNVMPIAFLGGDLLHRYYATDNGQLSIPMQTLLGRHAREKVELVTQELLDVSEREKRHATCYANMMAQIYDQEEDPGFAEASAALDKVTAFYKRTEQERLDTLATKERNRQPTTVQEWTDLCCHPEFRPRTDRSGSRGRKRPRNGSRGRSGGRPANPQVTMALPNTASTSTSSNNLQAPTPRAAPPVPHTNTRGPQLEYPPPPPRRQPQNQNQGNYSRGNGRSRYNGGGNARGQRNAHRGGAQGGQNRQESQNSNNATSRPQTQGPHQRNNNEDRPNRPRGQDAQRSNSNEALLRALAVLKEHMR